MADLIILIAIVATLAGLVHSMQPRKVKRARADRPTSRKHIRITHWSDRATITYYGHNGRKVTRITCALGDVARIAIAARSRGYRTI